MCNLPCSFHYRTLLVSPEMLIVSPPTHFMHLVSARFKHCVQSAFVTYTHDQPLCICNTYFLSTHDLLKPLFSSGTCGAKPFPCISFSVQSNKFNYTLIFSFHRNASFIAYAGDIPIVFTWAKHRCHDILRQSYFNCFEGMNRNKLIRYKCSKSEGNNF